MAFKGNHGYKNRMTTAVAAFMFCLIALAQAPAYSESIILGSTITDTDIELQKGEVGHIRLEFFSTIESNMTLNFNWKSNPYLNPSNMLISKDGVFGTSFNIENKEPTRNPISDPKRFWIILENDTYAEVTPIDLRITAPTNPSKEIYTITLEVYTQPEFYDGCTATTGQIVSQARLYTITIKIKDYYPSPPSGGGGNDGDGNNDYDDGNNDGGYVPNILNMIDDFFNDKNNDFEASDTTDDISYENKENPTDKQIDTDVLGEKDAGGFGGNAVTGLAGSIKNTSGMTIITYIIILIGIAGLGYLIKK